MDLGLVAKGIVRTFRYFRGSNVVSNKHGQVSVDLNTKGGISFFFEINYNTMKMLFSTAITLEEDNFCPKIGRDICAARAKQDSSKTYTMDYDPHETLLDQVFIKLETAKESGELNDFPYLRTLLAKMKLYDAQNADASEFYQDMIANGVITVPDDQLAA